MKDRSLIPRSSRSNTKIKGRGNKREGMEYSQTRKPKHAFDPKQGEGVIAYCLCQVIGGIMDLDDNTSILSNTTCSPSSHSLSFHLHPTNLW